MPTLMLMRHAKAACPAGLNDDFDRPLNARGQADVPGMARWVSQARLPRPRICSSSARRARETAAAMARLLDVRGDELVFDERLYLASPGVLARVAQERLAGAECGLVVAHNPGLEEWLGQLCGASAHLPTAAVAAVQLPGDDWHSLSAGGGVLLWQVVPRMLRQDEG
jgi:phosphohistidine phosphatase